MLIRIFWFTHDSLLAKEDVERCHIFLPGIVAVCFTHILKTQEEIRPYHNLIRNCKVDHLHTVCSLWCYLWLQLNEGVIVLLSIGIRQPLYIIRQWGSSLSLIDIFHLCMYLCWSHKRECLYLVHPHFRNWSIFQGTKRVQVKVSGVTQPEESLVVDLTLIRFIIKSPPKFTGCHGVLIVCILTIWQAFTRGPINQGHFIRELGSLSRAGTGHTSLLTRFERFYTCMVLSYSFVASTTEHSSTSL